MIRPDWYARKMRGKRRRQWISVRRYCINHAKALTNRVVRRTDIEKFGSAPGAYRKVHDPWIYF